MTTVPDSGAAHVDFDAWRINGQPMTKSERRLLSVLADRAGMAVSKRDLWLAMWGYVPQTAYGVPTSNALTSMISRLRRKGVPLVNIWGYGWLLPDGALIEGTYAQLGSEPDALSDLRRSA